MGQLIPVLPYACFIKIHNDLHFWCQLSQVVLEKKSFIRCLSRNRMTLKRLIVTVEDNLRYLNSDPVIKERESDDACCVELLIITVVKYVL